MKGEAMRKVSVILVIGLLIYSLFSGAVSAEIATSPLTEAYNDLTADKAKGMIEANPNIILLDVRTLGDFSSGHISGARCVPLSELKGRIEELDKDKEVIVYCNSGMKSKHACELLAENGFEAVYNMLGGINAWTAAGFALTAPGLPSYTSSEKKSVDSMIDSALDSNKSTFLFFYADWCHFSQQQKPIIYALEQEYAEKVVFIYVNAEENPQAKDEFGVTGFPTMVLIGGKEDDEYQDRKFVGYTERDALAEELDRVMESKAADNVRGMSFDAGQKSGLGGYSDSNLSDFNFNFSCVNLTSEEFFKEILNDSESLELYNRTNEKGYKKLTQSQKIVVNNGSEIVKGTLVSKDGRGIHLMKFSSQSFNFSFSQENLTAKEFFKEISNDYDSLELYEKSKELGYGKFKDAEKSNFGIGKIAIGTFEAEDGKTVSLMKLHGGDSELCYLMRSDDGNLEILASIPTVSGEDVCNIMGKDLCEWTKCYSICLKPELAECPLTMILLQLDMQLVCGLACGDCMTCVGGKITPECVGVCLGCAFCLALGVAEHGTILECADGCYDRKCHFVGCIEDGDCDTLYPNKYGGKDPYSENNGKICYYNMVRNPKGDDINKCCTYKNKDELVLEDSKIRLSENNYFLWDSWKWVGTKDCVGKCVGDKYYPPVYDCTGGGITCEPGSDSISVSTFCSERGYKEGQCSGDPLHEETTCPGAITGNPVRFLGGVWCWNCQSFKGGQCSDDSDCYDYEGVSDHYCRPSCTGEDNRCCLEGQYWDGTSCVVKCGCEPECPECTSCVEAKCEPVDSDPRCSGICCDGICYEGENACCEDGCPSGKSCINHHCVAPNQAPCSDNSECESGNCAACEGEVKHCCPIGEKWNGGMCVEEGICSVKCPDRCKGNIRLYDGKPYVAGCPRGHNEIVDIDEDGTYDCCYLREQCPEGSSCRYGKCKDDESGAEKCTNRKVIGPKFSNSGTCSAIGKDCWSGIELSGKPAGYWGHLECPDGQTCYAFEDHNCFYTSCEECACGCESGSNRCKPICGAPEMLCSKRQCGPDRVPEYDVYIDESGDTVCYLESCVLSSRFAWQDNICNINCKDSPATKITNDLWEAEVDCRKTSCYENGIEEEGEKKAYSCKNAPSGFWLCGNGRCYNPEKYECCRGNRLIEKDQDFDGYQDHKCCIGGITKILGCDESVIFHDEKNIAEDEQNCGGCGLMCTDWDEGTCLELEVNPEHRCNSTTPQCCNGTCSEPKPELTIESIKYFPETIIEDASATVVVTLERMDDFFESHQITTDNVEVELFIDGTSKGINNLSLRPDSKRITIFSWDANIPVGAHELKVVIDPNDKIDDCNKENNELVDIITVHPKPDLFLFSMRLYVNGSPIDETYDMTSGEIITARAVLLNIGETAANEFITSFSVDDEPQDYQIISLPGGEGKDLSFNWTAILGEHTLTIKADSLPVPDGIIPETNELNNEVSKTVNVLIEGETAPILSFAFEPGYFFDGVEPDTGNESTIFEYQVKYIDCDNHPPAATHPRLWLDVNGDGDYEDVIAGFAEGDFAMTEVNVSDTIYSDGKLYSYSTSLPFGADHTYKFSALDVTGMTATGAVDVNSGPYVDGIPENQAPNAPILVSPPDGSTTSDDTPTLSAHYSDSDAGDTGTTNYRISSSSLSDCINNVNIVASGTSAETSSNNEDTTWTPASSIGSDGSYYWCAQNNDEIYTSDWTSMGSFILETASGTYISDCAKLNITGETYYLTQNVNSTGTCMEIQANNITLDCQGHQITYSTSSPGREYGIDNSGGYDHITIKNGKITQGSSSISSYGICFQNGATDGLIENNTISTSGNSCYGIYFYPSSTNTISNNTISTSSGHGIYLYRSSDYNTISNNIISTSNIYCYGLYISVSSFTTISNNTISTSGSDSRGIYLYSSSTNTITRNKIKTNSYSIQLHDAGNNGANNIYNNLLNSTNNYYFYGTGYTNYWNTTKQTGARIFSPGTEIGGNYWTNPSGTGYSDTCTDADKDGFCDNSYILATGNIDYLPLSDEFSHLTFPIVVNQTSPACTIGSAYFSTIQDAVNSASDGDTIVVCPGTYTENVDVTKSLTIKSFSGNPEDTIVNALKPFDDVFEVTVNNVSISGFSVRNANQKTEGEPSGIHLSGVNYCNISQNKISNNFVGIKFQSYVQSRYNLVENCNISGNDLGIELYYSSDSNVTLNNISKNDYGILLIGSSKNTLTSNILDSNNGYGINLYSSSNNIIYNNYFNNINNAYDDGNNIWNITPTPSTNIIGGSWLGGNYWGDYVGKDEDGDGLGDTLRPYNSSGNIVSGGDWLPLVFGVPTYLVHNLNTSENFFTIQEAVYDSGTKDGHIIEVDPGIYNENVKVNKSLTIRSTSGNPANTIVNASNANDHVFEVSSDYVYINGFTIGNAAGSGKAGIYLNGANYCIISDNNALNDSYGIYMSSSSNNNIIGNDVSLNSNGILGSSNSNNNKIINNNANSNGIGIHLEFSSVKNVIEDNIVIDSGVGVSICWSANNNTISNNIIRDGVHAIYHHACYNNRLAYNTVRGNVWGVWLIDSNNNTVSNNNISNNGGFGVQLNWDSNGNEIANNYVSDNNIGVTLDMTSDNNHITNNAIFNHTTDGIRLTNSSNNVIHYNNASNNNYGIYLSSSSYNLIYNNYFNNTNNVWDHGTNTWNITKTLGTNIISGPYLGGNYWNDYADDDLDGDGLGDAPYNIAGGTSKDYLPLTINLTEKTDLAISPEDISFSNPAPEVGETVTITATIHNIGNTDATNVIVQFFNGDPDNGGIQIGSDQTIDTINAGTTVPVQIDCNTITVGTRVCVVVDLDNVILETNENNNKACNVVGFNDLRAYLQTINAEGWNQTAVDAANAILSTPGVDSSVWEQFFSAFFANNPFTDNLSNYIGYPVFWWFSDEVHFNLQEGMVNPLLNNIENITNDNKDVLSVALNSDPELLQSLMNSNKFLNNIVNIGIVSGTTKSSIYNFYKDYIESYPQYFKKSVTFDVDAEPYVATVRAQTYMNFRDTLDLTPPIKNEIAQTIGLTGRYLDIWSAFSVLVLDNNGFDAEQLDVVYNLLSEIPSTLHNLGSITCNVFLGNSGDKYIWFTTKSSVNIFSIKVGASNENGFPNEVAPKYSDVFSLALAHEVNHIVDAYYVSQNPTCDARKHALIDAAGDNHMNYLRSMLPDGYFNSTRQEFFASISNQWFADSNRTIELGLVRFDNGYKHPINQALFFADVYSLGGDYTKFYTLDINGNITIIEVPLTRDINGHIDSLTVSGLTYLFVLDSEGNVIKIETMNIIATCPVDLILTDPEGFNINKQSVEIPGATYTETDINGDGDPDDVIVIPDRKTGDYQITVIPEPDAEPYDTYTLEVTAGDTTLVLAEDVSISDIPDLPYLIESTEEGIIDKTPPIITIYSPANGTTYTTNSVNLNYTVSEPTVWVGYSLDGADNVTLDGNTTLTNLIDGAHTVTVSANDTAGNMNSRTVLFTINTTPPASITNLLHTSGQTWINWTWTNPSEPDFNHTEVWIDGEFKVNVTFLEHTYNATGLSANTTYEIGTRTVDDFGNVNRTGVNDTATTLLAPDNTPPNITNVTATNITTNSVTITWDTNELSDSLVKYGTESGDYTVQKYNLTNVTLHTVNLTELLSNTTYYYLVNSTDASGNANESVEYNFTTAVISDTTPPGSVSNLGEIEKGSSWILWNWTNPSEPDFNHTEVWIDGEFNVNVTILEHTYNATELSPSTTHEIGTRTVDDSGNVNRTWVNDTATTLIHDVNVSTDYAAATNGIKIKYNGTELPASENLTIGDAYDIYYKIVNEGDYNETVNVSVLAANSTWNQTVATHTWNIKIGEYRYSGGDSWDTTALTPGEYNITVNASIPIDDNWLNNERIRAVILALPSNQPPVADPNGPYNGMEGNVILFNGSGSFDSDGSIDNYTWDFGDGNTGTGEKPTHTYAQNGTYTVSLNVTDNDGATDTNSTTATIADTKPTANFSGTPTSGLEPLTVNFTDNSTSYDGLIWTWDFGDGNTSAEQNPSYTYSAGTYTVNLTVTEGDGDGDTETKVNYINVTRVNLLPVSDPNGPYNGMEGEATQFNGSGSYDSDGSIFNYTWDFGDGNTGTGVSPTHTYTQNGIYTINLNVTDDDGATDANTTTATIADTKPTANFSSTPTSGPEPLTVNLTDNSTSFDGITTWEWDFGDGDNSSEQNPTHEYANAGLYNVTLTVYEADGNSDTEAKVDYITVTDGNGVNQPPVADANGPYTGVEGVPITYNGSGSYAPDGSINLYEWDFDSDGVYDVSSASSTAIFTWGDDYTGTVELRVTDNDGSSDTDTATITVNNVAPTASIVSVVQPEDFILPYHSLTFNGAFIDAGWLDTHTATWDFSDGTIVSRTLTEENDPPDATGTTTAEHAYVEPGTHTVTLRVTDDDDGIGHYTTTVTVISAEVAAGIIIDQLGSSIVPPEAPKGVSQKIESAIDKLEQVIDFLDQGKYCDAIGKQEGMITQIEGAIDQVNEQRCSVKECKGKECICIADADADKLIESLEHAKEGAIAIGDLISAKHPECA